MKYYLDTEFNSMGGQLISLGLVREDNECLYLVYNRPMHIHPWVKENVMPHLESVPNHVKIRKIFPSTSAQHIEKFMQGDDNPVVITDWPDDISYFTDLILTGPGTMIAIPRLTFRMHRIDAYPTNLEGAVQHNAWWDAMALKLKCEELGLE
jgi:hypothetical protein